MRTLTSLLMLLLLAGASMAELQPAEEAELKKLLEDAKESAKESGREKVEARCDEIEAAAKLSPERSKELRARGEEIADRMVTREIENLEKRLRKMAPEHWKRVRGNTSFRVVSEPEPTAPLEEELEALLLPEEKETLKQYRNAGQADSFRVRSQIAVVLLDERLALNSTQRKSLVPLIAKAISEQRANPGPEGEQTKEEFYVYAKGIDQKQMRALLDDVQWSRWEQVRKAGQEANRHPPDDMSGPVPGEDDAEYFQEAISEHYWKRSVKDSKEATERRVLMAEDAARVAGVDPETAAVLATAARGAAAIERNAATNTGMSNMQFYLQNANAQNIKRKLKAQSSITFFSGQNRDEHEVWTKAVESLLSKEQAEKWKKETESRVTFRLESIANMILLHFDKQHHLEDAQVQAMRDLLVPLLRKHSVAIDSSFSYGEQIWYLNRYYASVPLVGIPDGKMKEILTKRQMDSWTASQEFANAQSYWPQIEQHN